MEFPLAATPERVWQALVDETAAWRPRDFYALPQPLGFRGFRIEARAGGRGYEYAEDGSELLWFTVIQARLGKALETIGHLTPDYGGPATLTLQLHLEPTAEGTLLRLSEAILGAVTEAMGANLREGWQLLFGEGFTRYLERGTAT
jgi:uncharacterized protein YndB with AHSA1/START domain